MSFETKFILILLWFVFCSWFFPFLFGVVIGIGADFWFVPAVFTSFIVMLCGALAIGNISY